ncbi:MAG: D-tyrosyl-tRNA(Tyr) deacylase [Pseudobutyrivibrio sp.]|nr:D-tyrosyl-tRNA(Tyr) deacylase [Pseudobutyrivibrio sp.]
MRLLVQRVLEGSVTVDGKINGAIHKGYVVFLGVEDKDTREIADKMATKLMNLRIFEDDNGKTNLSIRDVNGEILLISQFTLYADCHHGNRPSFINAGKPDMANELYEYMKETLARECKHVASGIFGAEMKVSLVNDGPFTIWLDSDEVIRK